MRPQVFMFSNVTADWSWKGNGFYFMNVTLLRRDGKRRDRTRVSAECWVHSEVGLNPINKSINSDSVFTWTCCLVSRLSCSLSTRWCPRCRSSPGSGCRMAALRLTGAGGAGWSGEPEEDHRWSCGSALGCRTWLGSRRATRSRRSWGGSESRAAPPTDTELRPLPSVWAQQGDDAAPRSPADLQGGGHWSVHTQIYWAWKMEQGRKFKGTVPKSIQMFPLTCSDTDPSRVYWW